MGGGKPSGGSPPGPPTATRAAGTLSALAWDRPPPWGHRHDRPPLLTAAGLRARGVVAAFTTRLGGGPDGTGDLDLGVRDASDQDRVDADRRRVLDAAGLSGCRLVTARQVHGADVLVAEPAALPDGPPGTAVSLGAADVLLTTAPGVALAVLTADCVPVLLADPDARVVVAVHAGWRGLVAGAVEAGVAALTTAGGVPGRTVGLVGPSVGPAAYEVGQDVHDQLAGRYPSASSRTVTGALAVDPAAAAVDALTGAGVGRIGVAPVRTHDGPFFSWRTRRDTGRQVGLVALLPAGENR